MGMTPRILEKLGARLRSSLSSFLEISSNEESETRVRIAVDDLRARLGRLIAEQRLLEDDAAAARAQSRSLVDKAEAAIVLGRDDLARVAVQAHMRDSARNEAREAELRAIAKEAAALEHELRALGAGGALVAQLAELDALIKRAGAAPDTEA